MSLYRELLKNYLKTHGITRRNEVNEIISGFDFNHPVYLENLEPGCRIFQYVRRPNAEFEAKLGRWFSLKGATMDSLGIFSGGSGRLLKEFMITSPVVVIEGTAKSLSRNWGWAGGGSGGSTQMFMPSKLFYALRPLGTHYS